MGFIFAIAKNYFQTKETVRWIPMPISHVSNNGIDKPAKIFKMLWFAPPIWLSAQKTHIMDNCE
jgi:hypothetical protein